MFKGSELRKIDEELSKIHHEKDAAIGRSNFDEAKKLADKESDLVERKAALRASWHSAGEDMFDGPEFWRFTDRARTVVALAQEEARLLNHSLIGTEHILLGLIVEGEGLAAKALGALGISLEAVREKVKETIAPGGSIPTGSPSFTPRAMKVFELSHREGLQLGHNYIGTEHLLLGLVREGEGVAAQVLVSLGADLTRVRQQVIQLLSGYQGRGMSASRTGSMKFTPAEERRTESSPIPVGASLTVQVVRVGRRPEDYASAYGELALLVHAAGFDLDDVDGSEITVTSVDTADGPGISVTHLIRDI